MDELARWLGEQLDEDERIARAVEDRSAPWDGQWMADGNSAVRTFNGHVLFYRHGPDPLKPGLADHVAEWDPARVLREIDAKRQLLKAYERAAAEYAADGRAYDHESEIGRERTCVLGETVRIVASVYSTRPGYAEAVASAG